MHSMPLGLGLETGEVGTDQGLLVFQADVLDCIQQTLKGIPDLINFLTRMFFSTWVGRSPVMTTRCM